MYKVLSGDTLTLLRQPVRRTPYIAVGSCVKAAMKAREYLRQELTDATPFPLAELVRAVGISLRDIKTSEQRWAVAHDMGHLMLGHPNVPLWYFDCEADVFARELLIPAQIVVPLRRSQSTRELARAFGVPPLKMEWALSEYSDRRGTFRCSMFPDCLECASISAISACRQSGAAPSECAQAVALARRGFVCESGAPAVALATGLP